MAWTNEQQQAINLEGKNIIVSAGAGSGKTAVLTARVQRKLLSGIHVNQLLVLTFTNAAAQEMKERIRKTIRKTPGLEKEEALIDGAYITTFDSFSLSIVKKYHTRLNITDKIQITDEVVVALEKKRILEEIFEEHYFNTSKAFEKLIHDFCLKDDKELKQAILDIYKKIELKYNKTNYLQEYMDSFINNISLFQEEYLKLLLEKQKTLQELFPLLNDYFDGDFVSSMEDNFKWFLEARSYDEFLKGCEYKTIKVPRGSDEEGKRIKGVITGIASDIKDLCRYQSMDEVKQEIISTRDSVNVIIEILQELDTRLDQYKMEHEIFTFLDISRLAIQVVSENKDIQEELRDSFQEILVDEYQDTSDTQEAFISLISNHNVYMVGDIKQSIYRFRNANPYLFKEKYDTYRDTDLGEKIDLLKNFRSRGEVLDDINLLFDLFMDDEYGGADYQKSHRMVFGNTSYIEEGKTDKNYHMELLTYDKEKLGRLSMAEEEAFLIGNDILDKINNHYPIFDKDLKILRDVQYRDFVILLDKSKDFDLYKKIFEYLGIPLTILKEESLQKESDILVLKNLLELIICIHNKCFDTTFKYHFTAISRSFLLPTSDSSIYKIFTEDSFYNTELYEKCFSMSKMIDTMNLSQFFLKVIEEFQYEEKLITLGNVRYYQTRLEYLYNLCLDYERAGHTIYDFVDYLNEVFDAGFDLKFNISTKDNDSCRVMTIHKSKGLEFPICYFAGLTSKFNLKELNERILYDNHYGIILPKVDEYYKDTILKTLLRVKMKKEEISERIRLFYVALTRAKEKMIFVFPKIEEESEVLGIVPNYERESYSSFYSILKSIYSVLLPYVIDKEIVGSKDYLSYTGRELQLDGEDDWEVEEVNIPTKLIEEDHYSKRNVDIITKNEKDLLEFGTKVHSILEHIDFHSYDLSKYDISDFIKKKILAFLNSDFLKSKLNYNIYKEYEFIDSSDDKVSHGIIDLLLESDDEIIIIDYKLKGIKDAHYQEQLNGYRKFMEKKTGKKVSCFLYSIMDEVYEEVVYA